MRGYYILYVIICIGALFLLVRYLVLRKTSLSTQWYIKGMRAENKGLYDEAAASYENALSEMKKNRLNRSLEIKIREKLKVLHTVITYERDQHFVRQDNSWVT